MDRLEEQDGSILIHDIEGEDRPDSGYVVSSGVDGVDIGEHILMPPFSGVWFRRMHLGGYRFWEVRFLGIADLDEHVEMDQDASGLALCSISDEGEIIPKWDWVLIKRDSVNEQQGSILLTDKSKYRSCKATVVRVGPKCNELEPGDRVIYHGPSIVAGFYNLTTMDKSLDGNNEDYAILRERAVYCKI